MIAAARPRPVVFIALHGPFGEDGTIQAILEAAGLAYTGSGVAASAIGMDKPFFKRIARGAGLPVLPWIEISAMRWTTDRSGVLAELDAFAADAPGRRVIVKPARLGSSVGHVDRVGTGRPRSRPSSLPCATTRASSSSRACRAPGSWRWRSSATRRVISRSTARAR